MMRLVVALAVLALLAVACEPDKSTVEPTAVVTPGHIDPADFNEYVRTGGNRAAEAGFSGTYMLRATVNGQAIDGAVTWHRSGPRARANFAGTVAGRETEIDLITGEDYPADDLIYVCMPLEEACTEAHRTVSGDYPADLSPPLVALRLLDTDVFTASLSFFDEQARTIVEQDVLCFVGESVATPAAGIDHGEVCLTETGLPLLVTASGSGTTVTLVATDVPGQFDDGAFDLPYALEQP